MADKATPPTTARRRTSSRDERVVVEKREIAQCNMGIALHAHRRARIPTATR